MTGSLSLLRELVHLSVLFYIYTMTKVNVKLCHALTILQWLLLVQ